RETAHDVAVRDVDAARHLQRADVRRARRAQRLVRHQRHRDLRALRGAVEDVLDDRGTGVGVDPDVDARYGSTGRGSPDSSWFLFYTGLPPILVMVRAMPPRQVHPLLVPAIAASQFAGPFMISGVAVALPALGADPVRYIATMHTAFGVLAALTAVAL